MSEQPEAIEIEVVESTRAARGDALPPDLGACARSAVRQCEQTLSDLARQAYLQTQVYANRSLDRKSVV